MHDMSLFRQIFSNLPYQHLSSVLIYIVIFMAFLWLPEDAQKWLRLDINAMQDQQIWRLISGHFLHTNLQHFLLNALAFLALWALHGQYYHPRKLFSFIMMACCFISGWLFFFDDTQIYVGFSGVIHALLVWGALQDIQVKEKTGYLLLIGVAGKVLWEQIYGGSVQTAAMINADIAVNAHLAGAIFALLYVLIEQAQKQQKKK